MRAWTTFAVLGILTGAAAADHDNQLTRPPVVRLAAPVAEDPPRQLPPPPVVPTPTTAPKAGSGTRQTDATPVSLDLTAVRSDLGPHFADDDACGDCLPLCGIPSRWSARADFGDGVGYTRGFSYLEAFVPFYQPDPLSVVFGDARVVNFHDDSRWEFNAGAGYRMHWDAKDAVLGANLFYDGRHTDSHFYHQIGLGGEALFDRWEFRCNGYIIVGPSHKLAAESQAAALIGNQLVINRVQTQEVAMGGLDAEIGTMLPVLPQYSPRLFVGYYHYSAERMQSINGVRGRFEAWLNSNVSLHCAVQNDGVFDTTVTGGFAIHFGGAAVTRDGGPRTVQERLGQRVVRDVNIVVAHRVDQDLIVEQITGVPRSGDVGDNSATSPPPPSKSTTPPESEPSTPPYRCLPFPGAPGDPATFPGKKFPPGFHHLCFPGKGRYKHIWDDEHCCRLLPRMHRCGRGRESDD